MTPHLVPRATATLHAGGMSIDYVRAGRGDTVIVLHAGAGDDTSLQSLIDRLALDHQVIVPALPSDDSLHDTLDNLLDNLLEGIGACSVGLVAVGAFGRLAQEFVASRPGRVSSLVTI